MKTYRVQIWNHGTRAQSVKHEEQQDVAKMINTIVDDRQHATNNLTNYYIINLIQSLPSPLPIAGNYSHMDGGNMEGWWSGDDDGDGDDFPSPEAKTAPRLALPRKNRGGGGSTTENWSINFCFRVSSSCVKIPAEGEPEGGPTWPGALVARPGEWPCHLAARARGGPLWSIFWLPESSGTWNFWEFSDNFLSYYKFPFSYTKIDI